MPFLNFFIERIKKCQVLTFTVIFLSLYRLIIPLVLYFSNKETFLETYKMSVWFYIFVNLVSYFILWLIVTWIGTKFTTQKLKEKFYRHPIATIIFTISFLYDLPYRLSASNLGSGLFKYINVFEIVIYYAFISFLWWMLACWVSSKIWKKQRFQWGWYKKLIDKIFIFLPVIYKFILGSIVAVFIFSLLFWLITVTFHYSGSDISKLFN